MEFKYNNILANCNGKNKKTNHRDIYGVIKDEQPQKFTFSLN